MVVSWAPPAGPGAVTLSILPVRALVLDEVEWSVVGHPQPRRAALDGALHPAAEAVRVTLRLPPLPDDLPPVVQGTVHARGRLGTPVRQTFRLSPPPEPR